MLRGSGAWLNTFLKNPVLAVLDLILNPSGCIKLFIKLRFNPLIKPLWMLTNKNDYHNYHNDEDTHTADDYNGDKDNIDE